MTSKLRRLICSIGFTFAIGIGCFPQSARALDTPNVLMAIDGMTMNHNGLFRNNTPNDGFGTFQFGPVLFAGGELSRFKSFHFIKNGVGDGGISHNARGHSDAPEIWTGTAFAPLVQSDLNLDSDVFPVLDRSHGGQLFDPTEYQIEVKFKPNMGVAGLPNNAAPLFTVGLDQLDGFVWDAEVNNVYKRANDAFTYNIGSAAVPLNDWYAAAPKDANGFATWTVPVTSSNFIQRGFYHAFGDGPFRTNNVLTGNGRVQNPDLTWADANDGLDTLSFGGGPVGPGGPSTQLKVPNGVPLISFGAPNAETGLSIQVKHIALKRITPNGIFARIDANSGINYRFGSALTYGPNQPPIVVEGIPVSPNATDQISRYDQNGMTNLVINARQPDAGEGPFRGYQYRFNIRTSPTDQSFDGTDPNVMMNIRAKLLPTNTATSMTITAKDLDGNDCQVVNASIGCRAVDNPAGPVGMQGWGADEYGYALDLSQLNTSTFTTISVPLSSFTLATFIPPPTTDPLMGTHKDSSGPFGFVNPGDGLRTNFNLFEFGAGVVAGAGLLRMEIEYMELRLTTAPPGLLGDFNEDDKVDAADYVKWRKEGTGPLPNDNGLATAAARFDLWRANFGNMASGSGAGAVPEPAAWLLMSLAAAFVGASRRRSV